MSGAFILHFAKSSNLHIFAFLLQTNLFPIIHRLSTNTASQLKKKLAELSSTTKRTWPDLLQQAVSALNATPKPGVLHGDSPEEVKDDPEVQFLLQQDQAKCFRHNTMLTEQRQARLESDGAFRAPCWAARVSSSDPSEPRTKMRCGPRASAAAWSPPRMGAATR
jgi:hypothetical protein